MESPRLKTTNQKCVKNTCNNNDVVRSPTRAVKSVSPTLPIKTKVSAISTKASLKENTVQTISKENTKFMEVKLQTKERAVRRAFFNYSVATKLYIMEQQKRQIERIQKACIVEVAIHVLKHSHFLFCSVENIVAKDHTKLQI
ncbi:TPX2-like protein [Artemisia annua]|uniref:TPX2-like protein n=1 Tax=Artemisia annua TaxID=35608 RepID=A0A2U1M0T7_ARTAN|nr:TPX2-like protein [Artemisia annua]